MGSSSSCIRSVHGGLGFRISGLGIRDVCDGFIHVNPIGAFYKG